MPTRPGVTGQATLRELLAELHRARGIAWQRRRLIARINALLAELARTGGPAA